MNNNINEQNNQGMNSTIPNGSGTFVNNVFQPTNQPYMNNNINQPTNQPTNQPYMNNNINQPTNQPFTNNNINQSVNPPYNPTFTNNNLDNNNNLKNNYNNINTPNYVPNNNGKNNNKTKKIIIISAIALGAVVVILILISLLSKSPETSGPDFPGTSSVPNAQKTLTCTHHTASFGVYADDVYEYYINEGSVSFKQTTKIDLKKTQINGNVDDYVKQQKDSLKENCNSMLGCECDTNYSKGNYLESIISCSEETLNNDVKDLTAEEIYGKLKESHENGQMDGLTYVCSGNGATTTNTNNQSVSKTIDYNSYISDSKSTEFDSLIDKKVTFTNVPAWSGYLGSLSKSITCNNESSLTIEDDVEYTVTGIITNTNGTVFVTLKDCTITKE